MTIPEGYVFVMGDNRNGSSDSRFFGVGFVAENEILGRAVFRIMPVSAFGARKRVVLGKRVQVCCELGGSGRYCEEIRHRNKRFIIAARLLFSNKATLCISSRIIYCKYHANVKLTAI